MEERREFLVEMFLQVRSMSTSLNCWRRPVAMVILSMSVVVVYAWGRSQFHPAYLFFPAGELTLDVVGSADSFLFWGTYHASDSKSLPRSLCWEMADAAQQNAFDELLNESRSNGLAFSMPTNLSQNALKPDSPKMLVLHAWKLHYGFIVFSLMLPSVWLILSEKSSRQKE